MSRLFFSKIYPHANLQRTLTAFNYYRNKEMLMNVIYRMAVNSKEFFLPLLTTAAPLPSESFEISPIDDTFMSRSVKPIAYESHPNRLDVIVELSPLTTKNLDAFIAAFSLKESPPLYN